MELWEKLFIDVAKDRNIKLAKVKQDTVEGMEDVFENKRISRRVKNDLFNAIIERLTSDGYLSPINNGGTTNKSSDGDYKEYAIFWRSPAEWGTQMYSWALRTGATGMVMTLFELLEGADSDGTQFKGLELPLIEKALEYLETSEKAAVIRNGPISDEWGVKFL